MLSRGNVSGGYQRSLTAAGQQSGGGWRLAQSSGLGQGLGSLQNAAAVKQLHNRCVGYYVVYDVKGEGKQGTSTWRKTSCTSQYKYVINNDNVDVKIC